MHHSSNLRWTYLLTTVEDSLMNRSIQVVPGMKSNLNKNEKRSVGLT